jgi:hypothetical protein
MSSQIVLAALLAMALAAAVQYHRSSSSVVDSGGANPAMHDRKSDRDSNRPPWRHDDVLGKNYCESLPEFGLYRGETLRRYIRQAMPGRAARKQRAEVFALLRSSDDYCEMIARSASAADGDAQGFGRQIVEIIQEREAVRLQTRQYVSELERRAGESLFLRPIGAPPGYVGRFSLPQYKKGYEWKRFTVLAPPHLEVSALRVSVLISELASDHLTRIGESPFYPYPSSKRPIDEYERWLKALGIEERGERKYLTGWGPTLAELYVPMRPDRADLATDKRDPIEMAITQLLEVLITMPVARGEDTISFRVDNEGSCYLLPVIVADLMQVDRKQPNTFTILIDRSRPFPESVFTALTLEEVVALLVPDGEAMDRLLDYCYVKSNVDDVN